MTARDLYTTKDIKDIRELILEEQDGECALLGIHIKSNGRTPVLDHSHDDEQLVRAVLEREANAWLGQTENAYRRFFSYWLKDSLPEVLRKTADYLEQSEKIPDTRFRHTGWLRKVKVFFNKLNAKQQDKVLVNLGSKQGKNSIERKKLFSKLILDRNLGYNKIIHEINLVKETK